MKAKGIFAILVIVAALIGGAILIAKHGVSVGGVEIGGSERVWLSERTYDFLEDIQFKDFDKASTYHLKKTQKKRDIPKLIQRVFQVRHEILDIMRFEVTEVDLDRSGARARVRTKVWLRVLGDSRLTAEENSRRQTEILFYWFRDSSVTPPKWNMELESSL